MTSTTPAAPPAPPVVPPVGDALGPFTDDRPCAPWGLRVLATLLDSALIASVAFLATGHAPALAALPGVGQDADAPDAPTAAWIAGTLLVLGALQAYTGMTPGKRVAGIAVVDDRSGRPIGLPGTVLRWFAHVLDTILLIGYLRSAFRSDGRTFADSLLGTVAVRTTTPELHPLVARLRAARDARAPWLRWPRRVTYAVALVLCAAAAAMSVTSGSGGSTQASEHDTSCVGTGDFAASAVFASSRDTSWDSRLGITRTTEQRWHVSVAWSTGLGIDASDNPEVGTTTAAVAVASPERGDFTSGVPFGGAVERDDGVGDLGVSVPDEVASATVAVPEDPGGWIARAALMDEHGSVVAECSATVPTIDADPVPDRL
ncbi:RDD family protein [Promicromonospora sp. Marseille-Q5078]